MPRTDVRWLIWCFVAFCIDDYGDESGHRRGITPRHAMYRLRRSWR